MKTQTLSPRAPVLPAVPENAREFVRSEKADATRRAYKSDCEILTGWCRERRYEALPLAPGRLAEFLASQAATGIKAMTLVRRVAAIRHAHRALQLVDPFDQVARATLAGIRNKLGVAVKPKAPLLAVDLVKLIEAIPYSGTHEAAAFRDRALLLLGFAGALRRSELVALNVDDLEFCSEGLRVTIRRSKTDQVGASEVIAIPFGSNSPRTCPVVACSRWVRFANLSIGPLFRRLRSKQGVGQERLDDAAVALILKKRAAAAGLDSEAFSAHSLRSGFLTSAAANGASLWKLIDQSRHRSVETVRKYVRDANIFHNHAGKGLL